MTKSSVGQEDIIDEKCYDELPQTIIDLISQHQLYVGELNVLQEKLLKHVIQVIYK